MGQKHTKNRNDSSSFPPAENVSVAPAPASETRESLETVASNRSTRESSSSSESREETPDLPETAFVFIRIDYADAKLQRRITCAFARGFSRGVLPTGNHWTDEPCAICRQLLRGPCSDCRTPELKKSAGNDLRTYDDPRAAPFVLDLSNAHFVLERYEALKLMWDDVHMRFHQLPRDVFHYIIDMLFPISIKCGTVCPVVYGSW